jgi:uncharacterized repeat protein (TIGR01451 family)
MRALILTLGLIMVLALTLSPTVWAAPQAPAATCIWNNSTGNWSDIARWSCGAVPGAGDTATINGGTVTVVQEVTVQGLTFTGGTLQGSNTLTVTDVMTWTGGTQQGSGATAIASGATLNVTGYVLLRQRTLNNAGTVNWTAANNWYIDTNAVLNNLAGATFNAQASDVNLGAINGIFNNQGTFIRSGPGVSYVTALSFNNSGTVQVVSGVLRLDGGGTSSGAFAVNAGARLEFNSSNYVLDAGATLTGAGLYQLRANTLTINGTLTVPNFEQINNTTLTGSGTFTVTQVMTWTNGTQTGSGATAIASGATLNVNGYVLLRQRTLNNAGTVNWTAADNWYIDTNAIINNLAGATFNAQANGVSLGAINGAFNNQGSFVRSGSATSSVTALAFNNTGTVNVESGVLQFNSSFVQNAGATWLGGGSLTKSGALVFNGGTLGGKGTITGTVSNIGGTVLPGSSPGILRIAGDYTQGPTGTLNIELGGVVSGTQYDLLDVTGAASLSGTLNVSLINSFTPISGTVFRIVNFSTRSGDFITTTGTNLGWLSLLPYYSSDHLSLIASTTMADLGISVTDGQSYAIAGEPITYTVVVTNAGPDAATSVVVSDTLPGTISNETWTCVAAGGSCGALSGSGNLSTTVDLSTGGVITFTIGGRLSASATGTLVNTTYASHPTDPDASNNSATDSDTVLYIKLYLPLVITQ